jgi:hypothetical protein
MTSKALGTDQVGARGKQAGIEDVQRQHRVMGELRSPVALEEASQLTQQAGDRDVEL